MSAVGLFKTKTPDLPEMRPVDEIVLELDEHLDRTRELVIVLRDRAKEAEQREHDHK